MAQIDEVWLVLSRHAEQSQAVEELERNDRKICYILYREISGSLSAEGYDVHQLVSNCVCLSVSAE